MSCRYPNALIIVFCKAPIVHHVKTRLMPYLTAQQAVDAHVELTERTLDLVTSSQLAPIQLWCSPDTQHTYFEQCAKKHKLDLYQQCEGDLGTKMHDAICSGLKHAQQVILVGTDCPSFVYSDLEQAIQALVEGDDVALGPAEDGGYVLIGMSKPYQQLFQDIAWGSDLVLSQTKCKIKELKLSHFETRSQWDVDNFKDWRRYLQVNDI